MSSVTAGINLDVPAENDEHLLAQLIEVGRLSDFHGLVAASAGNLSGRIPGSDRFFITASETWLSKLTPESFTIMSLEGEIVGGAARPSSEYKVHMMSYRVRPDINSVIHLHPQTTVLVDAVGGRIEPLTLDQAAYLREIGRIDFFPNGSDDLGEHAARAATTSNAIVMAHHGCSTLGDTVGMAYRRALNLEDAARATLSAMALGRGSALFPAEHMPDESVRTV